MTTATLIFISLVFLALAVIYFLLSRDDPIQNDVQTPVKDLPDDEKITITYPYDLYK